MREEELGGQEARVRVDHRIADHVVQRRGVRAHQRGRLAIIGALEQLEVPQREEPAHDRGLIGGRRRDSGWGADAGQRALRGRRAARGREALGWRRGARPQRDGGGRCDGDHGRRDRDRDASSARGALDRDRGRVVERDGVGDRGRAGLGSQD
jgi:hypothetical protein